MEFIEIAKLIAEIGFMAVAAGMFVFFGWKLFTKNQKLQDDLLKKLTSIEDKQDRTDHHPSQEDTDNLDIINNKIYQEMKALKLQLDADRSYVILFHNGGKSSSGFYFQKMSCICELVHSGISAMSNTFQNIHRASYALMLDMLRNNGEIAIKDHNTVKDLDGFLYTQLVDRHVVSVYMKPLKDSLGNQIGFIGIDYCSQNDKFTKEEIMEKLSLVSGKIAALVDIRDEVKK